MISVLVAPVNEFEDRGRKVVSYKDVEVGIFYVDGSFYAWHNECSHRGGPVCQGKLFGKVIEPVAEDMTVSTLNYAPGIVHLVCPWHGYEYDLKTGINAGDSKLRLKPVPVEIKDGNVYVVL